MLNFLPMDVIIGVLSMWLQVSDLMQLDVAYSGNRSGPAFRVLLNDSRMKLCIKYHGVVGKDFNLFNWIAKRCIGVEGLHVDHAPNIAEYHVEFLRTKGEEVKSLDIYESGSLNQLDVNTIVRMCTNVLVFKYVNVSGVSSAVLACILNGCPHLHTLSIESKLRPAASGSENIAITSHSYVELDTLILPCRCTSTSFALLIAPSAPSLRTIKMDRCYHFNNIRQLKDTSDLMHIHLALHCPYLVEIDLGTGAFVTDKALFALAGGCPYLKILNLQCSLITSDGLTSLAQSCTEILHVNLSSSTVGCDGICSLAVHCPNLQYLALSYLPRNHVTVAVLDSLVSCSIHLKHLVGVPAHLAYSSTVRALQDRGVFIVFQ